MLKNMSETPPSPPRGALTARLSTIAKDFAPPRIIEDAPDTNETDVDADSALEMVPDTAQADELRCKLCDKPLAPDSAYLATTNRWDTGKAATLCVGCSAKVRDRIAVQTRDVDWVVSLAFGALVTALLIILFGMAEANLNTGTRAAPLRLHFYPYIAVLPAYILGRVLVSSSGQKRGWPIWAMGTAFLLVSIIGVEWIARSAEFSDIGRNVPGFAIGFQFLSPAEFVDALIRKFDLLHVVGALVGIAVLVITTWPQRLYLRHYSHD